MADIRLCVIGRNTNEFSIQIKSIRQIQGIKVQKRRNKPFYDVSGNVGPADIEVMTAALARLLTNCGAELEIEDKELEQKIIGLVEPYIE